ncbi:MAG: 7-cyano-7-deazaguanine synthase [Nitrosopumilales archaeon]|nr:7-cyano-7-deazaguanine synthase [Nitrosopumilales archaeon]
MKRAVVVFSGGLDSVCTCAYLKSKYDLYGITFAYGQRASKELKTAKSLAKSLKLKKHKIVDIGFMKDLYGKTNVLTSTTRPIPQKFNYSIVVPIRNAVFLSIASAWAFTLNASLVAYGAHRGDVFYPDCRPSFSKKMELALNQGEIDGIKNGIRKKLRIWTPFNESLSKSELLKRGHEIVGDLLFRTWSCYSNTKLHCGRCESCNNRKAAFVKAKILDKTRYLS